ncbi:MAG: chromosome segregation protein SMC [Firmicutes bacterium]|nr:chromosome segregation protein SMC [Bacillota bacterium]
MLKLRKVDLLGFKSFCERTTITFSGTGVTCIVGPNGCGKSNIVDAISWVLGEQSHKTLRAERMADCIFNGTQKRPPMGLAEVSLTLVDPELAEAAEKVLAAVEAEAVSAGDASAAESDAPSSAPGVATRKGPVRHALHLKPGELVIGRRLYRSGQSEYLINGRVARLRDIQELFMGVGLGPNSYAIIEQGRIGQILSSKPLERRAIIEEAAGITKYKTKRRLAEAKLESSKLNLARVNDILTEVEKQLASLRRQASKARRYAELREQMRTLLRQVLAGKASELEAEAGRIEQQLGEIAAREAESIAQLRQLETEHERLAARSYALEGELRQNQNQLGQTALELDRTENRIGFNRERAAELAARNEQLARTAEQNAAEQAQLDAALAEHVATLAALHAEHTRLHEALYRQTAAGVALAEEERTTAARIAELRRRADELAEALARLHAECAQAEQTRAHCAEDRARRQAVLATLTEQAQQSRRREAEARAARDDAESESRRLADALAALHARRAEIHRQQAETSERFDRLREELADARARRTSLQQILDEHIYSASAVQKLFAANGEGSTHRFRAVGVLADYAEVEEQYEAAIEQFLREELEYVVVETFDHARAGIALLRDEVGGRASFFVDSLRQYAGRPEEPTTTLTALPGVVARLDRLIDFRDPLGAAAKRFLPRLRSAYLVENAAVAERLATEHADCQFLTPDGTCYQGRIVTGGRVSEAGPLATKRQLRDLEARIATLEQEAATAQATLAALGDQLRETEQELAAHTARQLEAGKALVAASHAWQQARAECERFETELTDARAELVRLEQSEADAQARAAQAAAERDRATAERTEIEVETARATERLAELRAALHAHQEGTATQRAALAALAERLAAAEARHAQLVAECEQARQRQAALAAQHATQAAELAELEAATRQQQLRQHVLAAEKARLEERRTALEAEWEQTRVRVVELEDTLRQLRQQIGDLREQRSQQEIERARNQAEREHLRTACLEELHLHPEDLLAQEPARLSGAELAAAEASYRELRARIESMGAINMMALEEYNECEQRYQFLSREREDLVKSIEDTQQTIRELDEVSRQKFEQAFRTINEHFAQAFATLFGGGTGEMRLAEPDSSGECGIDIVAQPPGKRLQNVQLLSGGEKALTALALLIAIFRFQPSPFCILDEVDAPLDEANIGRFTRLVAEMSDKTQFIIVTHNRRTMEMAPVLYGVTMQEPGVSKLVSVRWEQPSETASAQAAASSAA